MKEIEEKVLKDGEIIGKDIIKVDCFLNHQIDIKTLKKFAIEVRKEFKNVKIDKVLTIETSGIAVGYAVAEAFGDLPLLFAKKAKSKIINGDLFSTKIKSFTRDEMCDVTVNKKYLKAGENILIVDDFLAEGNAGIGLIDLCHQAGANPVGLAVFIEKYFQGGHQKIEAMGVKVVAGASIKAFKNNKPIF